MKRKQFLTGILIFVISILIYFEEGSALKVSSGTALFSAFAKSTAFGLLVKYWWIIDIAVAIVGIIIAIKGLD